MIRARVLIRFFVSGELFFLIEHGEFLSEEGFFILCFCFILVFTILLMKYRPGVLFGVYFLVLW